LGVETLEDVLLVKPRVPEIEVPGIRINPHRIPIRPNQPPHGPLSDLGVERASPRGDLKARGKAFHVPFPRPGKGLVEVVDVEDYRPVGRSETTKVEQMRVSADLSTQPGVGSRREVGGHDGCGAAIERERRGGHAGVPDRNQLRDPGLRLLLEHLDRAPPRRGRVPSRVARPGNRGARAAALRDSFGGIRVLDDSGF
jgi:hypothetical protein